MEKDEIFEKVVQVGYCQEDRKSVPPLESTEESTMTRYFGIVESRTNEPRAICTSVDALEAWAKRTADIATFDGKYRVVETYRKTDADGIEHIAGTIHIGGINYHYYQIPVVE